MFILFKIKYLDGNIVTIGNIQRLNKSDQNWYIDFIMNSLGLKDTFYNETQIDSFLFSVGFKKGIIPNKTAQEYTGTYQTYENLQIPNSISPLDYGQIILEKDELFIIQDKFGHTINIEKYEFKNKVEYFKNGILLLSFEDRILDSNNFIRIINNKNYHIKNNKLVLQTISLKSKFISKLKKSVVSINKFITFDIETYIDENNNLIPYLICFYDSEKTFSFWLNDFKNVEQMMNNCFQSLFIRKYHGYKIYIHNLAKFDIIFLLKYLAKIAKIEHIMRGW